MAERMEKIKQEMMHIAAEVIERESNRLALISVTDAEISPDLKHATFFVSVLPDDKAETAVDFCNRHAGDVRDEIKKRTNTHHVPFVKFAFDKGEKNRQRIDQLLLES